MALTVLFGSEEKFSGIFKNNKKYLENKKTMESNYPKQLPIQKIKVQIKYIYLYIYTCKKE